MDRKIRDQDTTEMKREKAMKIEQVREAVADSDAKQTAAAAALNTHTRARREAMEASQTAVIAALAHAGIVVGESVEVDGRHYKFLSAQVLLPNGGVSVIEAPPEPDPVLDA